MVEVNHHRIEVRRERYGLESEGARGATVFPKSVEEAISKMRSVEERARRFREGEFTNNNGDSAEPTPAPTPAPVPAEKPQPEEKQEKQPPAYSLGRLVHRTEPDLKTHTSYLLFAVLPRDWTEEDEQKCRERWPSQKVDASAAPVPQKSKKQMKREIRELREKEEREQGEKKDE